MSNGRPSTRETLLSEAVLLFNEKGFAAAGMGLLADRLGIRKSSLYHHVQSKEELLELALGRAHGMLLTALHPASPSRTAFGRLESFVRSVPDRPDCELPCIQLLLGPDGWSVTGARTDIERRVAELIRRAADEGTVRQDLPPDLCAGLLLDTIGSALARRSTTVPIDVLVTLALGGLREYRTPILPGSSVCPST